MNKLEQEVRENIRIEEECLKKLDIVRNELIPYYTENCILGELEELLWQQYIKYHNLVQKVFENEQRTT